MACYANSRPMVGALVRNRRARTIPSGATLRRIVATVLTVPLAIVFACTPAGSAGSANIFEGPPPVAVVELDPSVRSVGMGGASGAVSWGDSPNRWANPAFLGLASGLHYEDGSAAFLPGDAMLFHTHQTTLGYGGLGFALEGQPFKSLGRIEVDAKGLPFDLNGLPVAEFYERVRTWGVGVSLSGLLTSAAALMHRDAPGLTRNADLAFGYASKKVEAGFVPDNAPPATGADRDWGLLARTRLTLPGGGKSTPLRIEAAYGFSVQNAGDDRVTDGYFANPLRRHHRNAFAARTTLVTPGSWRRGLPKWLAPALDPLLSLGLAYDAEHATTPSSSAYDFDKRHYGVELAVANVVSVQLGHITSPGGKSLNTWGISAGIPLGRIAGVRYAHAVEPSAAGLGLPDTTHDGWSLWLDPIELKRAMH